ncbi:putative fungal specific transcription factor domain-containing protein [Colletotrichum sublineola]|uniref:Putative fungal specific transcription factor domain-containing protein n=1 Tax=Colletotrichum sublineola TaxID=1173701 RepID=A0A066XDU8_COLSU|nr:putative fungal specific transcription factor domain-containing protein [Colletotrichum sublineola]
MTSYANSVNVSTPTGSRAESEAAAAATRCDEQKPSCRACIAAGIECVTTDRRRPGVEVQRRETKRPMSRASSSSLTHSLAADTSPRSPLRGTEAIDAPARSSPVGETRRDDDDRRSVAGGVPPPPPTTTREPVAVIHEAEANSSQAPPLPPAKYQGKLPVVRASRGSNSVEILSDWLDLAARRLGIQQRRGLPSSADKLPSNRIRALLSSEPLPFPPKDAAHQLASSFLDGVNLVYPLVHRDRFRQDLNAALEHGPATFAEARGVAALSTIYLVLAVGFASDCLSELPPDARDYLPYCKTLLGHLVVNNNVGNVRAIILLALCLHCYDECAAAWNTLGVGVFMAVSLGLHKPRTCQGARPDRPNRRDDFVDEEEGRRFWLAIYAFEKLLAFEMGRLSAIDDQECYPPRVDMPAGNGTSSKEKAFSVTVDLARILGEIGRKAVLISRKEDGLRDGAMQAVITEKVQTTGEAQLLLTRWGESVPDELRLVILSRNSLLIGEEAIAISADTTAKGKPWDYMLRNGQSLAANSARKVLRIVVEAVDCKSNAILPNLLAPLHALSTLAVHVVTHPDSRISTMDLQLIQTSSDSMREIYARVRGDDVLNLLLQKLDGFLQHGIRPPASSDSQRVNAITAHTPRSEPSSWHPAGETPGQRATEASWAGGGEKRPREEGSPHMPEPAMAFFGQGHVATGRNDAGFDSFGAMPMVGDEWSPSLSDGIGWDWTCFSQLLAEQYHPQ